MGKRGRKKQRESSPGRITARQRLELEAFYRRRAEEAFEHACDPGYPAARAVAEIIEVFGGEWPGGELFAALAIKSSVERLVELGDAAVALDDSSRFAQLLAGFAADADRNPGKMVAHLERAAELEEPTDDPIAKVALAGALIDAGRVTRAFSLVDPLVLEDPDDLRAYSVYTDAIQASWRRNLSIRAKSRCPCGSGKAYKSCCLETERKEVERFVDRSPLYELREAINPFLEQEAPQRILKQEAEGWFDSGLSDPHEDEDLSRMFYDWAVVAPDLASSDDDDSTILSLFAQAPGSPDPIRERSAAMANHHLWGLWQVRDITPAPGLPMVDLVSAVSLYVACAPEQIENLPMWTVMMGPVFAVDGVWRLGGSMVHLTPVEADRLVPGIFEAADMITDRTQRRSSGPRFAELADLPASAFVDEREGSLTMAYFLSSVVRFLSSVVRSMFPTLIAQVTRWREAPMQLRNTDGDPLLLIEAKIEVEDLARVTDVLHSHPDFEPDPEDDSFTWQGREMTDEEARMNLDQARALFEEKGWDFEEEEGPRHWLRGSVKIEDGRLALSVNSRNRLDYFLRVLEEAGWLGKVVDETRIDPSQDLPHVPSTAVGGFAAPMPERQFQAWKNNWVEESVPALAGMSPREAANDDGGRVRLEALLRQFEYQATDPRAWGQVQDLRLGLLDCHDVEALSEGGVDQTVVE